MQPKHKLNLMLTTMLLALGCDDRATRVALEAVDQQARQNLAMKEVNERVTKGTTDLVAADAASRRELMLVHRELQAERKQLNTQWNDLELRRRELADIRRRESLLLPLAQATGGFLLVAAVLGFCWFAILSVQMPRDNDSKLEEILIEEVVGRTPRLLSAETASNRGRTLDSTNTL